MSDIPVLFCQVTETFHLNFYVFLAYLWCTHYLSYTEGEKLVREEMAQCFLSKFVFQIAWSLLHLIARQSFCDTHAQTAYSVRGRTVVGGQQDDSRRWRSEADRVLNGVVQVPSTCRSTVCWILNFFSFLNLLLSAPRFTHDVKWWGHFKVFFLQSTIAARNVLNWEFKRKNRSGPTLTASNEI